MSGSDKFSVKESFAKVSKDRDLRMFTGGLVLIFISVFLPWYSFQVFADTSTYTPGLSTSGLLLLGAAALAKIGVLNPFKQSEKAMRAIGIFFSLATLALVLIDPAINDIAEDKSLAYGWWIALVGSLAVVFFGFKHYFSKEK